MEECRTNEPESTPPRAAAAEDERRRVADILSRAKHARPGGGSTLCLALATAVLMWGAFTPLDWGPLAWISLVPLLILVLPAQSTRWMYRTVFGVGLLYWLVTLQWMRLGDPAMFLALLALALYLACYWPVFLWLARTAQHRLHWPLVLSVPLIWTGLEYLRAHLLTGFAWYFLGHTQYRWVEMTQISDLFGAYGVSFVVAAANAALVQLVPPGWLARLKLCEPAVQKSALAQPGPGFLRASVAFSLLLVLAAWGYGLLRRHQGDFPIGPRVGLVQGNFVATVRNDQHDPREIFLMHRQLSGLVVAEQPDVILWPEGMFPYPVYENEQNLTDEQLQSAVPEVPVEAWRSRQSQQALADLADMTNAALIIGASVCAARPADYALYNSALFVQPGVGLTNRYDKIHRVPFGEYIPLRETLPGLQSLTPFRGKFGIDPGTQAQVFRYKDWQLIPLICFEDTVPHLVLRIARAADVNAGQGTACLVNLTNDGWFHGSSELEQHLITASFRAIETRTPLVRAVNTGISAVIDGDGVVREPATFIDLDGQPPRSSPRDPRTGKFHKQLNCALVADVPLDPRSSPYVIWGDWFALLCLAAGVATAIQGLVPGRRPIPQPEPAL